MTLCLRDISIKQKLTLIIMLVSVVAVLLVSGGFLAYERATYRQTMTQKLSTLAEMIGNESTAALSLGDQDRANEILGALRAEKHIVAAAFYRDGHLFARYPEASSSNLFPESQMPDTTRFEKEALLKFYEIHFQGDIAGTLYLKSDLKEMHERFERYAEIILLFTLSSTFAVYLLATFLQRIITRPIFHLAETAKSVSAGRDYSLRATHQGNDELGQLIDGFNEMLGQIQQRDTDLQNVNERLEKRVSERTLSLREEIAERRKAQEGLQQQLARISLLNQITRAISERQDTDSILHVVLRQLEDHLDLDLGAVALFRAEEETLSMAALRVKNPLIQEKLACHEGCVLRLRETQLQPCLLGQTFYMPDTFKGSALLTERLAGAGLRSAVAVPLLVENKLYGVLIASRLRADSFLSGECEFLRTLSEHVALAAHQAGLHGALERAYNELRQTQHAVMQQERLKALGQMASGIAHDVNNALSPVVGFADLLMRGENGLSGNGKKYLQYIRTAGEDIAHIVARLREFYRRRDDNESLQELNLNKLAMEVVDMTRPRWRDIPQSRGVTVEVQTDLTAKVPDLVGIESEVREALTNLVLNAVDALPKGGRITVRTTVFAAEISSSALKHPAHVIVEVSDTGVGMSEETRRRCLEPFFSTKGKRGTGLGLAMVYGVMERHEGKIEVESESGKGSTFRLIFPVREMAGLGVEDPQDDEALEPLRILCIDDEPLLRELIKEILERDGHRVATSESGQAGLELFRVSQQRGQPFDIVITDLGMPYFDGRQVATALKQESPETPIIMLTGWGAFMKEEGDAPAHVDGVLSKPPRSAEIRETLRRIIHKRNAKRAVATGQKLCDKIALAG